MDNHEKQSVGFGSIQSKNDYRYVNVEHLAGVAGDVGTYPEKYHIDFSQVPDLYQRKIGACTGHAVAEMVIKRNSRVGGQIVRISPRFTYTLSKINDGTAASEQGTFCNMPLKMGVAFGFATEDTVLNDTTLSFDEYIYGRDVRNIPQAAFDEAIKYRIPGYAQVGKFHDVSEANLKQALMMYPDGVKACLPIGNEWWTAADGRVSWASADLLPIRKPVNPVSGHDITITGWENEGSRCKIYFRNHWSLGWADQDNGWFYLDDHIISEAWVISEIPDQILSIIKGLPSQKDFNYTWSTNLKPMMQGEDVKNLQIALKILGTFQFNQPVTNYYGGITKKAVMKFQAKYNVASPAEIDAAGGALGPQSRATLNSIFSRA